MKTAVVTISTREPWEPYYFHRQFKESAKRNGIEPIYLDTTTYGGLMSKPKLLKRWIAQNGEKYEYLIVCDAWDIIWASTVEEVLIKYDRFKAPIVFNAEQNCFPRADLADQFPPSPTPFRFLNSGFFVGRTGAIWDLLLDMNPEAVPDDFKRPDGTKFEANDQEYYAVWYLAHQQCAALDYHGEICQALHGTSPDDLVWDDEIQRVRSKITGTYPVVFHGNGSGKDALKKIIGWLKL